jgi:hypothetical protein
MRFTSWLRRLWVVAVIPAVVVALACNFSVSPETARNPVDEEHTIDIQVNASFTLDPQAPPLTFDWDITVTVINGPNTGATGECSPSCSGSGSQLVTWTYESDGDEGTDTIQVCIDFESETLDQCQTVTKRWFDPSTPTPTATSTPTITPTPTATNTPRPNVGGVFGPLPNRNLTPAAPPPAAPPAVLLPRSGHPAPATPASTKTPQSDKAMIRPCTTSWSSAVALPARPPRLTSPAAAIPSA